MGPHHHRPIPLRQSLLERRTNLPSVVQPHLHDSPQVVQSMKTLQRYSLFVQSPPELDQVIKNIIKRNWDRLLLGQIDGVRMFFKLIRGTRDLSRPSLLTLTVVMKNTTVSTLRKKEAGTVSGKLRTKIVQRPHILRRKLGLRGPINRLKGVTVNFRTVQLPTQIRGKVVRSPWKFTFLGSLRKCAL